ncbi:MAG: peptidylprolyl isomerase [Verrucomicrobia bacterium]|nr:peptidylprolyl isomerase [Verrucomicrobiota bacterium]
MMRAFAFVIFLCFSSLIAAMADEVAVFDVQWGRKRDRQTRSFAFAFFDKQASYTVYNFKRLVAGNFYVKTTIHRVIPNYLVQGGDPLSKGKDRSRVGTGGPGYTLPPEINRRHLRGSVAMGRLGDAVNPRRLSNGSQFYVCLQPIPAQDGKDTVFGEVVAGLDALDEISRLPADSNANPVDPVVVTRTYLIDRSRLGGPPVRSQTRR